MIEFKEFIEIAFGPTGGVFAVGAVVGGWFSWSLCEKKVIGLYKGIVEDLKNENHQMKVDFTKRIDDLTTKMIESDEKCREEIFELNERIIEILSNQKRNN